MRYICVIAVFLLTMTTGLVPAAADSPTDFQSLYQAGTEARLAGNFTEASEYLEQALELSPANADVLLQLGLISGYQENYAEGERLLVQAVT